MYNVDDLYESGKLPARYYNQLNGKTAQENYQKIVMRRRKKNEGFIMGFI